jgi:hypothetical protein
MKLSNKILIGFFGFAFIYLTAVFAEVRLRGIPNIIDKTNSVAETADISGVSYLVIQDLDHYIAVIGSDQPRLEVRSISGDLLKSLKYNISGDTLTLSKFQAEEKPSVSISVFVPKAGLKGMTVNDSRANVKGLEQELLYISQNAGQIFMSDNRIDKVHLEVSSKSYLHITATSLDTLSAKIDNSEVIISSPVGVLKGSMENNSSLQMSRIDEIQFKKDENSRLNLYQ